MLKIPWFKPSLGEGLKIIETRLADILYPIKDNTVGLVKTDPNVKTIPTLIGSLNGEVKVIHRTDGKIIKTEFKTRDPDEAVIYITTILSTNKWLRHPLISSKSK